MLSQTRSSNNATGRAVAMHIKETDMRFKFLASLALLFSVATMWPASLVGTAAALEDTEKTISYLLDYVARTDATFIRNGREATDKQAADHLRQKWDYFRKTIKTPEDFIQLAATKSELSGKLYLVRLGRQGKPSGRVARQGFGRISKEIVTLTTARPGHVGSHGGKLAITADPTRPVTQKVRSARSGCFHGVFAGIGPACGITGGCRTGPNWNDFFVARQPGSEAAPVIGFRCP